MFSHAPASGDPQGGGELVLSRCVARLRAPSRPRSRGGAAAALAPPAVAAAAGAGTVGAPRRRQRGPVTGAARQVRTRSAPPRPALPPPSAPPQAEERRCVECRSRVRPPHACGGGGVPTAAARRPHRLYAEDPAAECGAWTLAAAGGHLHDSGVRGAVPPRVAAAWAERRGRTPAWAGGGGGADDDSMYGFDGGTPSAAYPTTPGRLEPAGRLSRSSRRAPRPAKLRVEVDAADVWTTRGNEIFGRLVASRRVLDG